MPKDQAITELANYYEIEINKERENQEIAFQALMKLIAPANKDQAIELYCSISRSSERQGWLANEQITLKLREERIA